MISFGDKILVLDGAMGTMIQRYSLSEVDYRGDVFCCCDSELRGNNECLNLTRPDVIKAIHKEYIEAGADIIETNTFSANRISQTEYGCECFAGRMAYEGARIAREVADEMMESGLGRKVWVAGSVGPTSKSLSLSPDVSDPAFRAYSFEQMREAYAEQIEGLVRGGVDMILVETCFDALNVKAALAAIRTMCCDGCVSEDPRLSASGCEAPPSRGWHVFSNTNHRSTANAHIATYNAGDIPVMVSVSVGDRSGRTLTGQTLEAFYTSVKHGGLVSFGLNCSLGAAELMPLVQEVSSWCGCGVSCYPNAGLPNEMGGYDQSPAEMATQVREMAVRGLVNIVGGCCGTTPEHIRAIAEAVRGVVPRKISCSIESLSTETGLFVDRSLKNHSSSTKTGDFVDRVLKVSGLEAVTVDMKSANFTNVGERTNVAGSRKFARLIAEGKYEEALQIAAKQIEDGANIIDINMDDAMLDSTREMERFVRYISNDPDVARAALMIDSSHWETIVAGLQNAQGKCIVNSISLKEGQEAFIEKARVIKSYGAAVVVMAFDETSQATTYERKIEICNRAYKLLVDEAGFCPSDIIFDVNILSIGTGIEEHARYAVDFIEAVRWIKANLPGALTSGGVSNLSFAFRGNNAVREAMHSAFLYHAIKAGLDMAIVNPSMLQVYDDIEPELLKCVEDVIFNTDPQATERLIEKASEILSLRSSDFVDWTGQAGNDGQRNCCDGKACKASSPTPIGDLLQESVAIRLQNALIKGLTANLEADIKEALTEYGTAVAIIEGPLMSGMETVGRLFGEGKMFLPQVVKSAKVMRDAVALLEPYMETAACRTEDKNRHDNKSHIDQEESHRHVERAERVETSASRQRQKVILATVKGDVHDIGKNITGIVLTCNGFEVHDLGVMVDKEKILDEAVRLDADIVAVSGLITPSLYQMEEICREMSSRGMAVPLFVGGATTSAVHTAVKLAPLYGHVFHGPDASAAAVMAKKCMLDRNAFETEQHEEQERLRALYRKGNEIPPRPASDRNDSSKLNDNVISGEQSNNVMSSERSESRHLPYETYITDSPADIPVMEVPASEVLPFFDWKMFYAIWGVKYGSAVPEAMELMQLRRDAEDEIALEDFRIMLTARFFPACSDNDDICFEADGVPVRMPMMRQEAGKGLSLADFVIPVSSGKKSVFGMFAISVHKRSKAHVQGCSCPACSNAYEDMVSRTVRMTVAEATSVWLNEVIRSGRLMDGIGIFPPPGRGCPNEVRAGANGIHSLPDRAKIIKPAAGYSSCPDHTLKEDILTLLCGHVHMHHHGHKCSCGHHHGHEERQCMGIGLTESYAMTPESSICGLIFMHPQACYPEVRRISQEQYDNYTTRRGMDPEKTRRFLGHLLK